MTRKNCVGSTGRRSERGLSLVELMVGVAIGLMVVAGATLVASTQLNDSRKLLLETQLQQDLRAAADIITRELRRAGSAAVNNTARVIVWNPATGAMPTANGYTGVTVSGSQVGYTYYRSSAASGGTGPFGFQLVNGTIRSLIDGGSSPSGWQDLTDSRAIVVDTFSISENSGVPAFQLPCPNDCPGGGTACWPTVKVRELTVTIAAHAAGDTSVTRTLKTVARLRNDVLSFSGMAAVCP